MSIAKTPSVSRPRACTVHDVIESRGARTLLDVRDEDAFVAAHVPGSGNVPLGALDERRHELPPPEEPLLVVGETSSGAEAAARRLADAGYSNVAWLDARWSEIAANPVSGDPARLWRPAPFLERVLPGIPPGRAIDVACGSGRNAVFMALSGFQVEACDHDADGLRALERLASRHGVTVATRLVDLESNDPHLSQETYALVVCFRFLHRPLLPRLAEAVAPGGYLVYETYRAGQEQFGRPKKPKFLLQPGELRSAFPGFEILRDEEPSPPGGPLTSRLLARKP